MKRLSSTEFNCDPKRIDRGASVSNNQCDQTQANIHSQTQQMENLAQQLRSQQHEEQKQQSPKPQQQQQQQRQPIQQLQDPQQQQYAASQYYPQSGFYNNFSYGAAHPPAMVYNGSSNWNFLATPPPASYYPTTPVASAIPPPLPPPELKPEKPPLPRGPEPGGLGHVNTNTGPPMPRPFNSFPLMPSFPRPGDASGNPLNGGPFPRMQSAFSPRMRNGMNGNNSFNGWNNNRNGPRPRGMMMNGNSNGFGMRGNSPMNRNRRRFYNGQYQNEDGSDKQHPYSKKKEMKGVVINKKPKRKSMATRYTQVREWNLEEAEKAIALEKEYNQKQRRPMLILKFPDPDINKYIVKKYSPSIETVHFQQPATPRYCFVQLKEDADVEKVTNTIRQIPFGSGKIAAELKNPHVFEQPVTPEEIDPYTLYIGNLPTHISIRVVKQYFPNAQRIDIGYAQRMKYTRYAFIRYNTVDEAMESYKRTVHALLDSRSLIVRFRRQKGNIGLPGERKTNAPPRAGREVLPNKKPMALDQQEGHSIELDCEEALEEEEDDDIAAKARKRPGFSEDMIGSCSSVRGLLSSIGSPDINEDSEEEVPDTKKDVLSEASEILKKSKANKEDESRPMSPDVAMDIHEPDDCESKNVEGDIQNHYISVKTEDFDDCYQADYSYNPHELKEPQEEDDDSSDEMERANKSNLNMLNLEKFNSLTELEILLKKQVSPGATLCKKEKSCEFPYMESYVAPSSSSPPMKSFRGRPFDSSNFQSQSDSTKNGFEKITPDPIPADIKPKIEIEVDEPEVPKQANTFCNDNNDKLSAMFDRMDAADNPEDDVAVYSFSDDFNI